MVVPLVGWWCDSELSRSGLTLTPQTYLAKKEKKTYHLGRALGYLIFSLVGLKRILFTNIFQKL